MAFLTLFLFDKIKCLGVKYRVYCIIYTLLYYIIYIIIFTDIFNNENFAEVVDRIFLPAAFPWRRQIHFLLFTS